MSQELKNRNLLRSRKRKFSNKEFVSLLKELKDQTKLIEHYEIDIKQGNKKILMLENELRTLYKGPRSSNPWKVFEIKGESYWFRPAKLSYVSNIYGVVDNKWGFTMTIDGRKTHLVFETKEKAQEVKSFILNIDEIPKTMKGEANISSVEKHVEERNKLLGSLGIPQDGDMEKHVEERNKLLNSLNAETETKTNDTEDKKS